MKTTDNDRRKVKRHIENWRNNCRRVKRCGSGIESDVYETVCSFLNRFGGDILLGVEDNGNPIGIP